MEVKVLGSVSPYPKGNSNCPGFLVETKTNKILLDCGSGSVRLMNFPDDINNLNIIISHYHRDHYSDLASIAYASHVYHRLGYLKKRIKVFIPFPSYHTQYGYSFNEYGREFCDDRTYPEIDYQYLTSLKDEHFLEFITYDSNSPDLQAMGIEVSSTIHPVKTYSARIENEDGILVYSADTGFDGNSLVDFAEDADLLICEATFLRGQLKADDYHLYAYEAACIAKEAKVKKLMLTHFWPEIDKRLYVEEAREIFPNTIAAEEGQKLILRRN